MSTTASAAPIKNQFCSKKEGTGSSMIVAVATKIEQVTIFETISYSRE